jgi:hypothetical protein
MGLCMPAYVPGHLGCSTLCLSLLLGRPGQVGDLISNPSANVTALYLLL